jgi:hypothetical protein
MTTHNVRDLEDMAAPRSTGGWDCLAAGRMKAGNPVTVIVAWERSHRNIADTTHLGLDVDRAPVRHSSLARRPRSKIAWEAAMRGGDVALTILW